MAKTNAEFFESLKQYVVQNKGWIVDMDSNLAILVPVEDLDPKVRECVLEIADDCTEVLMEASLQGGNPHLLIVIDAGTIFMTMLDVDVTTSEVFEVGTGLWI